MKALLLCLNTAYEQTHKGITGKFKRDYVGQIRTILHKHITKTGKSHTYANAGSNTKTNCLYDVKFEDGAVFCCDDEQLRIIKED